MEAWLGGGDHVDARLESGCTMLMGASVGGDEAMVAALLERGASVNLQNNNGVTALRYAVAHGNADVAEFLRAHGAAEVEGGRLSISPSAAGTEVPETFTNPSPRSAGEASAGAASL